MAGGRPGKQTRMADHDSRSVMSGTRPVERTDSRSRRLIADRWIRAARGAGIIVLVTLLAVGGSAPVVARGTGPTPGGMNVAAPPASIDPALEALLDQVDPTQPIAVIAVLRDQVDPRMVKPVRGERHDASVVRALKKQADGTQGALRAMLKIGRARGDVLTVTPLWIVNAIAVTARPDAIRTLANRPEIASVGPERSIQAPDALVLASVPAEVEPNIAQVRAPDLWDLGYRGAGVVVASMDTGVDGTHPDLADQLRPGPGSWFDPYGQHATPTDLNGHGTQTMGIMVGRSAGGSAIGMAPDATWIAAKIFNDNGVATSSAIHLAYQWILDPDGDPTTADAPSVVNESWALGAPGCNLEFEPDLEALVAAGITPVFAAGNFGPSAGSAPSPANNPAAFAVGAIDGTDAIADFSSHGPTSCGRAGSVTYPDVTAPGVDIASSGRYGLYETSSGTSVAAPHVSGALALLRGAFPQLTAAQIEAAVRASAVDLGPTGPDDVFGTGRLDVRAAFDLLDRPRTHSHSHPDPNTHPDSDPDPDADPNGDPHTDADSRTHTNPDSGTHAHSDPDADPDPDPDSDSHTHPDPDAGQGRRRTAERPADRGTEHGGWVGACLPERHHR